MRRIVIAATALAILAVPARAQGFGKGGGSKDSGKEDQLRPGEEPRPVVDEKKYKSAVGVMGDQTQKYDPWGGVREKPADKAKPR
jgi:hypothetical protein